MPLLIGDELQQESAVRSEVEERPGPKVSWQALGSFAQAVLSVVVPIVAIISFDDLFFDAGFGLLAGMSISLGYAAAVIHQTVQRGEERVQLDAADAAELVEICGDYPFDLLRTGVLLFIVNWLLPAGVLLLQSGEILTASAILCGAGVLSLGSWFTAREGVERLTTTLSAKRSLERGVGLALANLSEPDGDPIE